MENEPSSVVTYHPVQKYKAKTSLRVSYDGQVALIKNQLGDLEKIRQDLGLSQRQISRLLMVDPSSWTRWVKKGDSAPPHIYRALQWLMIIREKLPGLGVVPVQDKSNSLKMASQLDTQFFENQMREAEKKREEGLDQLQLLVLDLQNRMSGQNRTIKTLFFAVLLLVGILIGRLVKSIFLPSI